MNNPICPCIFIKKSETGFAIIVMYVDDLNLVGTPEELTRTTNYFKKEFEMKDLEPRNVEECRHKNDWPKWKEVMQAKLNSLTK